MREMVEVKGKSGNNYRYMGIYMYFFIRESIETFFPNSLERSRKLPC
jgi:hypothetical protein